MLGGPNKKNDVWIGVSGPTARWASVQSTGRCCPRD